MPGEQELLAATAAHGFISPATIAGVLGLEERLIIELIDRLGGEVHFPNLATELAQPLRRTLEAELTTEGTYTLRVVDPDAPPDQEIPW